MLKLFRNITVILVGWLQGKLSKSIYFTWKCWHIFIWILPSFCKLNILVSGCSLTNQKYIRSYFTAIYFIIVLRDSLLPVKLSHASKIAIQFQIFKSYYKKSGTFLEKKLELNRQTKVDIPQIRCQCNKRMLTFDW